MIEVIFRSDGQPAVKNQINGRWAQVSFNSDGRLVVRVIDSPGSDTLLVFGLEASRSILNFAEIVNHGRIKFNNQIAGTVNPEEIPF